MPGFPVNAETEAITIARGNTPPQHRHTPDSVYARYFTVSAIGCAAFLLWERLNDYVPAQRGASIELGWNELTRTLGLTPGRGAKVLARLVDFHLVKQIPADGWFAVRSAAPTLKPAQLERLAEHCPQLAASHDTFAAATAA